MKDKRDSAFSTVTRSLLDHVALNPPSVHLVAYITGGLKTLIERIKLKGPESVHSKGHFTNENGHFVLHEDCVLAHRYKVVRVLSTEGQSSVIVQAVDTFQNDKIVVIKILHAKFYALGIQESHCLLRLSRADSQDVSHTLKLLNTFCFESHYCMVLESLQPASLLNLFSGVPSFEILSKIRKITIKLLQALAFLEQQNVIHADLKPENILFKDSNDLSSLKVVDFGNAIQCVHNEVSLYYEDFELQTPLYRAPEVMFGMPFSTEIDMWSVGCILAELYTGKPLFTGTSKNNILKEMVQVLGPFPSKLFQRGKFYSANKHFTADEDQSDATYKMMKCLKGCRDFTFANFLASLLRYNPDERLTPLKAAQHPFMHEFGFSFFVPTTYDLNWSVLATEICQNSVMHIKGGNQSSNCGIPISSALYHHTPVIDKNIMRQHPSSYDLLKLGTTCSDSMKMRSGKVAVCSPFYRGPSPMSSESSAIEPVENRLADSIATSGNNRLMCNTENATVSEKRMKTKNTFVEVSSDEELLDDRQEDPGKERLNKPLQSMKDSSDGGQICSRRKNIYHFRKSDVCCKSGKISIAQRISEKRKHVDGMVGKGGGNVMHEGTSGSLSRFVSVPSDRTGISSCWNKLKSPSLPKTAALKNNIKHDDLQFNTTNTIEASVARNYKIEIGHDKHSNVASQDLSVNNIEHILSNNSESATLQSSIKQRCVSRQFEPNSQKCFQSKPVEIPAYSHFYSMANSSDESMKKHKPSEKFRRNLKPLSSASRKLLFSKVFTSSNPDYLKPYRPRIITCQKTKWKKVHAKHGQVNFELPRKCDNTKNNKSRDVRTKKQVSTNSNEYKDALVSMTTAQCSSKKSSESKSCTMDVTVNEPKGGNSINPFIFDDECNFLGSDMAKTEVDSHVSNENMSDGKSDNTDDDIDVNLKLERNSPVQHEIIKEKRNFISRRVYNERKFCSNKLNKMSVGLCLPHKKESNTDTEVNININVNNLFSSGHSLNNFANGSDSVQHENKVDSLDELHIGGRNRLKQKTNETMDVGNSLEFERITSSNMQSFHGKVDILNRNRYSTANLNGELSPRKSTSNKCELKSHSVHDIASSKIKPQKVLKYTEKERGMGRRGIDSESCSDTNSVDYECSKYDHDSAAHPTIVDKTSFDGHESSRKRKGSRCENSKYISKNPVPKKRTEMIGASEEETGYWSGYDSGKTVRRIDTHCSDICEESVQSADEDEVLLL